MKLFVGLGNPESRYDQTRHNVGFFMLDQFAKEHASEFSTKPKFRADIAEVSIGGEKALLVKPLTYYNDSGLSYRSLIDFYKLDPADTLIVHDELALPFGTVRMRRGGSDAGNNGIKSINAHGGQDSARIRVGVASQLRHLTPDVDFVLGKFSRQESDDLMRIGAAVHAGIEKFISGSFEATSYTFLNESPVQSDAEKTDNASNENDS